MDAKFAGATFTVRLARRALVLGADLTVAAVAGCSTITRSTNLVQAQVACATFLVVGACDTQLAFTDLTVLAIAVVATTLTLFGSRVTRLSLLAFAVFSTTGAALSSFADGALATTLLVIGARATSVGLADLTVLTIRISPAVPGDTLSALTELVGTTILVGRTGLATVVGADFSVFAIAGLKTLNTLVGRGVALLVVLATFVIATASLASVGFADLTGATLRISLAGSASAFVTHLATGACLLLVAHRILASTVFTDLTVLTSGVAATASHTPAFFADIVVGAVLVTGAVRVFALVALADLSACAILVLLACVGVVRLALAVRADFALLTVAG